MSSQMTAQDEGAGGRPESASAHVWMGGYGWRQRGARFPWFGLLLVALGVALAVDQAELGIAWAHSLALLVGLAAWVAFLVGWGGWAGLGAVVLTGWGAARVAQDVGLVSGSGWAPLLIGAGFLALYLVGLARQAGRYGWAVWVGLILVVVGGAQVAAREIPGVPPLDELVVPLILVGLGAFLIVRGMRRNAHGGA